MCDKWKTYSSAEIEKKKKKKKKKERNKDIVNIHET